MSHAERDGCLAPLDPEGEDPGYWSRFRERTMALAEPELARRARRSRETVSGVVARWSRAIVPLAAAAAATAALLIVAETPSDDPAPAAFAVESLEEPGTVAVDDPITVVAVPEGGALAVTMVDEPF